MTVIVPFLAGSRQLKIELEEPVVYLRGPSTSTRCHILRGIVALSLSKPLSATSVEVKLVGKSRTDWPEGIGPRKRKLLHDKVILEMQKTLYQVDPAAGTIPAGTHRWLFEFSLPYSMVETVQDDSARVSYYLSATVRRPGPSSANWKWRRDILVLRIVQPEDHDDHGDATPMTTTNNNANGPMTFVQPLACADVEIRLDRAIVVAGTQLPLELTVVPHIKDIRLECVSIVLQEHKMYRLPLYNACRSEAMNVKISLASATSTTDPNLQDVTLAQLQHAFNAKNAHIPLTVDPFAYQLMLQFPNCHFVHHSTTWTELEFRHHIQIRIELTVAESKERTAAEFKVPITVLDCRLKGNDFGLPTYQEAVVDNTVVAARQPTATSATTTTTKGTSRRLSHSAGHTKITGCCPCFVHFQKQLRTTREEWTMFRRQQAMLPPPPAYEQIQPQQH